MTPKFLGWGHGFSRNIIILYHLKKYDMEKTFQIGDFAKIDRFVYKLVYKLGEYKLG